MKLTDDEVRAIAYRLAREGSPAWHEFLAQPASELRRVSQTAIRVWRSFRYRNRIIARAARHIGQTRRGSNGWREDGHSNCGYENK